MLGNWPCSSSQTRPAFRSSSYCIYHSLRHSGSKPGPEIVPHHGQSPRFDHTQQPIGPVRISTFRWMTMPALFLLSFAMEIPASFFPFQRGFRRYQGESHVDARQLLSPRSQIENSHTLPGSMRRILDRVCDAIRSSLRDPFGIRAQPLRSRRNRPATGPISKLAPISSPKSGATLRDSAAGPRR